MVCAAYTEDRFSWNTRIHRRLYRALHVGFPYQILGRSAGRIRVRCFPKLPAKGIRRRPVSIGESELLKMPLPEGVVGSRRSVSSR